MPGSVDGDTADSPVIDSTQAGTKIGLLKGIVKLLGFGSSPATPMATASYGLQSAPVNLFEMTTRQTGVTQKALYFPTTIACAALPTIGSGNAANLTNGGNVCGGVFSPDPQWDSVLLDFAVVGQNAADTVTIEIGRVKTGANTIAEVLATGILTASATTLGPTLFNPFNGAAHASVTWRFLDATALTQNNSLGLVLQSLGGTSTNLSQLQLSCHNVAYYYVVITALADGGTRTTNVLCTMTPQT